jgi:hypothetical protein
VKKNQLKFLKNRPIWLGFDFISLKLKKLNRTDPKLKKPSQTALNWFLLKKPEPNRTKPKPVIFFNKNQIKPKIINPLKVSHNMALSFCQEKTKGQSL